MEVRSRSKAKTARNPVTAAAIPFRILVNQFNVIRNTNKGWPIRHRRKAGNNVAIVIDKPPLTPLPIIPTNATNIIVGHGKIDPIASPSRN